MSTNPTPLQRVCSNLLPILAVTFKMRYETLPTYGLQKLQSDVGNHLDKFRTAQIENRELDMELALELAGKLGELLTRYNDFTPQEQGLIVAAARYFIAEEDAMPDTDSGLGLDDDIAIFNAVVNELALGEMVIYT